MTGSACTTTPTGPPLRVKDRATRVFRDCDVVVTGWTDVPIPWRRCRPLGVPRSHPSLPVNQDLAAPYAARRL
jgi:hypothetical protein